MRRGNRTTTTPPTWGAAVTAAAVLAAGWLLMRAGARRTPSPSQTSVSLDHHRAALAAVSRESFAAGVRATHALVGQEYDQGASEP